MIKAETYPGVKAVRLKVSEERMKELRSKMNQSVAIDEKERMSRDSGLPPFADGRILRSRIIVKRGVQSHDLLIRIEEGMKHKSNNGISK